MPDVAVAFVDIETLGLIPRHHAVWEIALITRVPGELGTERTYQVKLTDEQMANADPTALRLNGFYERYDPEEAEDPREVAREVARLTAGAWFVAANPAFDAERIDAFLRDNGQAPAWHYRLVCVENLAAGRLGIRAGWDPAQLSEMLGVERPESLKHTAMGDAHWAMLVYDAVFSVPPPKLDEAKPKRKAPAAAAETKEDAPKDAKVEDAPPSMAQVLADLRVNGGPCEDCMTHVPPEQAVMSMTRHRKVLCANKENGGCYARYGTVAASAS